MKQACDPPFPPLYVGRTAGRHCASLRSKCESALQNWEEPRTSRLRLLPVRPLFPTRAGCEPRRPGRWARRADAHLLVEEHRQHHVADILPQPHRRRRLPSRPRITVLHEQPPAPQHGRQRPSQAVRSHKAPREAAGRDPQVGRAGWDGRG